MSEHHEPEGAPPILPSIRRYIESEHVAWDYDRFFAFNRLFQYDAELLHHWLPTPGRLLDLGCGTGRHVLPFAQAGYDVTGVDLSRHMLAVCREKLSRAGRHARLIECELNGVGRRLAGETFDYAICMFSTLGMIHGRANRVAFLRQVAALLRPGGTFVTHAHNRGYETWTGEGLRYLVGSFFRRLAGRGEWGDKVIRHYRGVLNMVLHLYSRKELEGELAAGGFAAVEAIALNADRTAPLRPRFLEWLRANGFILRCRPA